MHITPIIVHGERRYRLDLRSIKKGQPSYRTKAEAQAELDVLTDQKKSAGEVWLTLSAQERQDLAMISAEIRSAGKTMRDVWDYFKKNNQAGVFKSLETAAEEVLQSKREAKRRESYISRLDSYLRLFYRGRENVGVRDITVKHIEDWFSSRNESAESKASNIGLLSTLFEFCWRRGYIPENPTLRLEKPSIERRAPKILTNSQTARALVWTVRHRPDFLGWLVMAVFVGLRPKAEAFVISWDSIDLKRKRVTITADKTKVRTHRVIDLTQIPNALAWLELAHKLKADGPMCRSSHRRCLRRLRKALRFKKWPQDILRHTAASNLLAFHQDAGKVAHLLGNSAGTLLRRYKAIVYHEDAAKFFAIKPSKRMQRSAANP